MGRLQKKTCDVCLKTSDHLKKHMKRHEQENEDNVVNKGMKKSFTSGSDKELENEVPADWK